MMAYEGGTFNNKNIIELGVGSPSYWFYYEGKCSLIPPCYKLLSSNCKQVRAYKSAMEEQQCEWPIKPNGIARISSTFIHLHVKE